MQRVLDALEVPAGWSSGTPSGRRWPRRLAPIAPARCEALVIVNGGPAPQLPPLARGVLGLPPLRFLQKTVFGWNAYSASTPARAFTDPRRIPLGMRQVFALAHPPQLDVTLDAILAGDAPLPPPRLPTLLLWGAEDRLLGSDQRGAPSGCSG